MDLWNFCCLILASEVLLFWDFIFPWGLSPCQLPYFLHVWKIFNSMSNVPQEVKARPWHLHQLRYSMELFNSVCLTCFPALCNQSTQGLAWMGGWESPFYLSLARVSVWEQSGRSGSGCMHAKGDIRAMFHTLAFAKSLSVLVSNQEKGTQWSPTSPTQKKCFQLRVNCINVGSVATDIS